MMYINDLLGKQVINQATGERLAPVRDIVLSADVRTVVALLIGGGGIFQKDHVVRWSSIRSLGDVVVIDAGDTLAEARDDVTVASLRDQAFQLTGLAVISNAGRQIGAVADMAFDERGAILGFALKHGVLEGRGGAPFLPIASAQTIGRDAIITTRAELPSVREYEESVARASGEARTGEPR